MMRVKKVILFLFLTSIVVGCSSSTLTMQREQSVTRKMQTIAFMPIVNATLPPDQLKLLAEAMMTNFQAKNPSITFATPQNVALTLSQVGKLDDYIKGMELYAKTSAINTKNVKDICSALNVTGLLQGILYGSHQHDGSFIDFATTKATFGYSLMSCVDGSVIWSASSESSYTKAWAWDKAAPLYSVMMNAQQAIYKAIPEL